MSSSLLPLKSSSEERENESASSSKSHSPPEPNERISNKRARLEDGIGSKLTNKTSDDIAGGITVGDTATISNLPDGVLDSIISYFTSLEMISQVRTLSKTFQKATERGAEAFLQQEKEEKKRSGRGWSLYLVKMPAGYNYYDEDILVSEKGSASARLFEAEYLVMQTFHFDTLGSAAHYLRHKRLGRGTLASFSETRDNYSNMFHTGFGGLIQYMGGVTPNKSMFAKTDLPVMMAKSSESDDDHGESSRTTIYRFIAQIYYRNSLMLGGRDYFSVGLVNNDYKHFSHKDSKKPTKKEEKINESNCLFVQIPPLDPAEGWKNLLGIVVNFETEKMEVMVKSGSNNSTADAHERNQKISRSFKGGRLDNSPLYFAVRQEYDPKRRRMGRNRRMQYGNHDFAIRESTDEEEWNRLFSMPKDSS